MLPSFVYVNKYHEVPLAMTLVLTGKFMERTRTNWYW